MPAADSVNRSSVGAFLRESRTSRGIPLEEAARVTRIGKNYLTALEEDKFTALPNSAYLKGFLRAYAAFLGLSGDEVVAMYERAVSPSPSHPAEENAKPVTPAVAKMKASRRGRRIVSLVLLVLVVATAYLFDDRETRPDKTPPPPEVSPATRVAAPVLPARSSARRLPATAEATVGTEKSDLQQATAEPKGSGIVLKLKVNQDSWLNITIDNAISQQYDLKAGDLIEWKGERTFALDLGNAGGVEAEFNGKPLKMSGEPGESAHIVLKADDTQL